MPPPGLAGRKGKDQDAKSSIDTNPIESPSRAVDPSLVTLTHAIYALHAASLAIGIIGAASIIGAFLFGVPSIIAVVLNYVRRADVRGTWLESHFSWQIRTFWFAMLWAVIGGVLLVTIILIPVSFAIWAIVAIWVIYRVVRGWLNLRDGRPMSA
jgi:uncharacterized membrane protein